MADVWDQFPDHPASSAANDPWSAFPDHPSAVQPPQSLQTPNLDQFTQQNQQDMTEVADTLARGQTSIDEKGLSLIPHAPAEDGSQEFTVGQLSSKSPQKVSSADRASRISAFRTQYGGNPVTDQTYDQMSGQIKANATENNTPIQDVSGAVARIFANPVKRAVGIFSPKTAANISEGVEDTYAPANPDSLTTELMQNVAAPLYDTAAILASGPAAPIVGGGLAAGETRTHSEELRRQGVPISLSQDLTGAITTGALNYLTAKANVGAMTQQDIEFAKNAALNAGMNYARTAGVAGFDNAIGAAANNIVNDLATKQEITPESATAGIGPAMLGGAVGGVIGRAAHKAFGPKQPSALSPTEPVSAPVESTPQTETPPAAAPAETPAPQPERAFGKLHPDVPASTRIEARQAAMSRASTLNEPAYIVPDGDKYRVTMSQPAEGEAWRVHPSGAVEKLGVGTSEQVQTKGTNGKYPDRLDSEVAVGDWYRKTFGEKNAEGIDAMLAMSPDTYVKKDIPLDQLRSNDLTGDETNATKVSKYATQNGATAPPVIAFGAGEQLDLADGGHRLAAAAKRGDTTISAYVPEKWAKEHLNGNGEEAKPLSPFAKQNQDVAPAAVSARKADVNAEREALGLNRLDSPGRRTDAENIANVRKNGKVDQAVDIAHEIIAGNRDPNAEDLAAITDRRRIVKKQYNDLATKLKSATDPGDRMTLTAELNRAEQDFNTLDTASITHGTRASESLNAHKLALDEDGHVLAVVAKAKVAKGEDLSPAERAKVETLTQTVADHEAKIAELQGKLDDQKAHNTVQSAAAKKYRGMTVEQKNAELQDNYAKLRGLLRNGCHDS